MIPLIVIGALSILAVVWPGPKLDHAPPTSGGIFAPQNVSDLGDIGNKPTAPTDIYEDYSQVTPCREDNCGKVPQ